MILIDFDKLMEAYNDFYDEFTVHDLRYLKKECLPIVKAIPIEWIEKWQGKQYCLQDEGKAKTTVIEMLDDWEKENGTEESVRNTGI